ncbi:MFS transporter [Caballeronia sp. LjRoot34]|jgi:MFS family permease|uniref:MFS transporter n=2 Tax=unclassified Caballeronia TaxID=2646786 RepID=UPI003ED01A31
MMPDHAFHTLGWVRWRRLMPVIFLLYTIAYFDRVNIGMALPSMSHDLDLSSSQAGFVAGVFFWGYLISFIAGGWLAPRFGAKRTILGALLLWGFFSMSTGLVRNVYELSLARFLLGLAEGPVWASMSLLLSQWFVKSERGRAFGFWNLAIPFGALLSGPISGFVLTHANWHTMFVLEGLPAWLWAIVWWKAIPSGIETAHWLPDHERTGLEKGLAEEKAAFAGAGLSKRWRDVLRQPAVWLFMATYSMANMVAYGFGLWLPSAIKAASALNVSPQMIGWLNALPYLASVLGLLFITHSSDRFQERRLHVAIPLVLIGVLLYAGSRLGAHLILLQMVVFTLIGFFLFMNVPLVSALITDIFPRELAIPTIAVTGGIGNLAGGFIGPLLVGGLKQMTGNFSLAFGVLGAVGILGGVFVSAVRPLRLHQSDTQSSLATDGRAKQS